MAAHRYWRLLIRKNGGHMSGYTGCREIEFRESVGGSDATGSGTASSSHNYPGYSASWAFDNNTANEWATDTIAQSTYDSGGVWLKYDFGAGVTKDIVEVLHTPRSPQGQNMTAWELQWSDDNSSWTTLFKVHDADLNPGVAKAYSAELWYKTATSKRFWRLNVSANNGHGLACVAAALTMKTTPGGTDQCTGGQQFAASIYQASGPSTVGANAFDNNAGTFWNSQTADAVNMWIGYLFASALDIVEFQISTRNDGSSYDTQAPKNFTLEYWDGSAFQVAATYTNETGWTNGQTRTYTFGAAPASARPVALICT